MKRDKIFVAFIVLIACVIAGALQYLRSPETPQIKSYLTALDSNLRVFGEGYTNEVYSFTGQLKPCVEGDITSVEDFVEEQQIIDEFTNTKQITPIICLNKPTNYISFYLSLTNSIKVNSDILELKTKEEKSSGMIIPLEHQNDRLVNEGHVVTHKIVANDNLYDLAKKYYNDESKWITIYEANKNIMSDPHSLKIGQELIIPKITVSI